MKFVLGGAGDDVLCTCSCFDNLFGLACLSSVLLAKLTMMPQLLLPLLLWLCCWGDCQCRSS
jgi:hypothetical protein